MCAAAAPVLSGPGSHAATPEEVLIYRKVKAEYEAADRAERKKLDTIGDEAAAEAKAEQERQFKLYSVSDGLEFVKEWSKPHVRKTPADLLAIEAGQFGNVGDAQNGWLKDTDGAEFTYVDDFETRVESWNAQAALLWPLIFKTGQTPRAGEWSVPYFGILPSVALHRYTTNEAAKDAAGLARIQGSEVDELTYRFGFFAPVMTPTAVDFVLRANGLWQTDTGHEGSTYGVEVELEPLFQANDLPWLGLGFFSAPRWAWKNGFDPNDAKTYGKTWLAWQARLRGRFVSLKVEQDAEGAEGPDVTRAGVTAELNFSPLLFEDLQGSLSWTYLGEIAGDVLEENALEAKLSYAFLKRGLDDDIPGNDRKMSVNLTYQWGNADLLGTQRQDILTLSLGVLF
jgi:hypothetical protein